MPNVHQIRERLASWLSGNISLAEFEDWFVPETWNMHKFNDREAESLVDDIELSLSEYSGGYLSREQLLDAMRSVLASGSPNYVIGATADRSASVAQVYAICELQGV
jgi:hypothetical protein